MKIEIKQNQIPQLKQTQRIKLAKLMELPEVEFAKYIKKIEKDPLFKRLLFAKNPNEKIIRYKRFYRTSLSKCFYEFNDEITIDRSVPNIEGFLEGKEKILNIARKIGREKFEKYFIYCQVTKSVEQIAQECKLKVEDVKKLMELVNTIAVYEEFFYPSSFNYISQIHYTKVASFIKDNSGHIIINFFSPYLSRGRYTINYDKLEQLKKSKVFSKKELKQIDRLIKNLEFINARKTTLFKILQKIFKEQKSYLASGEIKNLKPYTQKKLAKEINVDPSLVSRAIRNRSVETPFGEIPLKDFFSSTLRRQIKNYIEEIIAEEKRKMKKKNCSAAYNDGTIARILKDKYRIQIAVRTVAKYRNELKIPNVFKRKNLK